MRDVELPSIDYPSHIKRLRADKPLLADAGEPAGPIDKLREGLERLDKPPEPQVIAGEFRVRENGEERTQMGTDGRQMDTDAERKIKGGKKEAGVDDGGSEAGRVLQETEEKLRGILAGLGIERMAAPDVAGAAAVIRTRVKREEGERVAATMAEAENGLSQLVVMIKERLGVRGDALGKDMARAIERVVAGYAAVERVARMETKTKTAAEALGCLETLGQVKRYLENQTVIDKAIRLADGEQWDRLYALKNEGALTETEVKTLLDLLVAAGKVAEKRAGLYPNRTSAAVQAEDVRSLKPVEWTRAAGAAAEPEGHRLTQMGDRTAQIEEEGGQAREVLRRGLMAAAAIVVGGKEKEDGDRTDKTDKTDRIDRIDGAAGVEAGEEMTLNRAIVVFHDAQTAGEVTDETRKAVTVLAQSPHWPQIAEAMKDDEGPLAELLRERTQIITDGRQRDTDSVGVTDEAAEAVTVGPTVVERAAEATATAAVESAATVEGAQAPPAVGGKEENGRTFTERYLVETKRLSQRHGGETDYTKMGGYRVEPAEGLAVVSVWLDNLRQMGFKGREENDQLIRGGMDWALTMIVGCSPKVLAEKPVEVVMRRLENELGPDNVSQKIERLIRARVEEYAHQPERMSAIAREVLGNYLRMREVLGVNEQQQELNDKIRRVFGLLEK